MIRIRKSDGTRLKIRKNGALYIARLFNSIYKEIVLLFKNRVLADVGTFEAENYLENKKNMTGLDTLMDKYYPGLSRGIYERKAYYNQDLNKNIMLIELGAKENTIEEVTNTIEALTFIFNKYINGDDK